MGRRICEFYDPNPARPTKKKKKFLQPNPIHQLLKINQIRQVWLDQVSFGGLTTHLFILIETILFKARQKLMSSLMMLAMFL